MRRFWFDGDAQFAPIGTLSGGERRRLQLLLTLVPQPNVLLLDEPTNDLDLDTLRAMEDFLDDWPGIVVTVSHDRAFLDRVTDELLALDGKGGVRWIRGGVGAWLAQRAEAEAAPLPQMTARAPSPSRTKPAAGRSPSTVRRDLGQAERNVATAIAARDKLEAEMASTNAHWELSKLGEQLAAAQAKVAAAEEQWLALAAEAESLGLTP
jgi:ATP-binding cassette subfamily F protein uup